MTHREEFAVEGFYRNRGGKGRSWQVWNGRLPDIETARLYLESGKKLIVKRGDGFTDLRIVKVTYRVVL